MLCFFSMGFVDLVGIASNYVQKDLGLTDGQAGIMPSLVFFWFLIFSVPTGMLMNKIGRKKTVLLSILVTVISLIVPIFGASYPVMLFAFSLLGIGNALMQTSLNPLVASIVGGDSLASTLTFGQFVKAIASFLAPYLAMWGATAVLPSFGLEWKVLFPIYAVIGILAIVALSMTSIHEDIDPGKKASTVGQCFALLGKPYILLCFLGIMCHVGIDVGTNTYAPKILIERLGWTLDEAAFATSLYFIFRTIGCFTGSGILAKISSKAFLGISSCMIVASMICLAFGDVQMLLYVGIALVGYGNSNVFSICFSQALLHDPDHQNEISGLMIMGLFGGTLFPIAMGYASDAMGTIGAVVVMAVGALYLCGLTLKIKK
ncbi:MAG: MFS transporter [Bacteroidales bacterium]|nr:MFS transporter [Candidatus Liminaster caballi]